MRLAAFFLLLSVPGSALAKPSDPCARPQEELDAVSDELRALWKSDKEDRENVSPDTPKNDAKRIKAVSKLARKGLVCTPSDAFHAGWVLQRSLDPDHVKLAHGFAKKAMEAHVQNGAWLAAVTFDLLQIRHGHPQRYGTQMTRLEDGRTCLYPVEADATDDERKVYEIRPIAETYRQVLDYNGLNSAPATPESLALENLWCPKQDLLK